MPWRWTGRPKLLKRFFFNNRGTSAVEFGLLATPFLGIVFATLEVGYTHFQQAALAEAVDQVARTMAIGSIQNNTSINDVVSFRDTYLCASNGKRLIPSNFDCNRLAIDVRPASSLNAINVTNDVYKSASNKFCPGQGGTTVVMRVTYPLPTIFPVNIFNRSVGLANDVPNRTGWFRILSGSAIFMIEPFGSYVPPSGC